MGKYSYKIGSVVTGGPPKCKIPPGSEWIPYYIDNEGQVLSFRLENPEKKLPECPPSFLPTEIDAFGHVTGRIEKQRFCPPTHAAMSAEALQGKWDEEGSADKER